MRTDSHAETITRHRYFLTVIWIAFLILVTLASFSFCLRRPVPWLFTHEFFARYWLIGAIYVGYLGDMMFWWFAAREPFKTERIESDEPMRFKLALIGSAAFNIIVLGILLAPHFLGPQSVDSCFSLAKEIAGGLSVLVAPAVTFYFGTGEKPKH